MPAIVDFIQRPTAFDPEALSVMGLAYESALKAFSASAPDDVREVIATRIIDEARAGERDPDRLCRMALSTIGVMAGE